MTDMSSQGRNQAVQEDLEQPTASRNTIPRSFDLEYPEIPLHLSLDSLLAHSSSTGSLPARTTMLPPEADQRSIDDSWASLGGYEASSEDDLQSEHTDVGSLLDAHSSDDVHSVADGINTDDGDSTDEEDLGDTLTEELGRGHILGPFVRHDPPSQSSSFTTAQSPYLLTDDVENTGPCSVSTYTTSRQLTESEMQRLLPPRPDGVKPTRYISSIQMPVLDEGLDLNTYSYFKVILLGRQVEQFRPEILRKLGDTLVSRSATAGRPHPSSVTRYHLVPNTFGPGAKPDFADLVAIDKQLDADCYDQISFSRNLGGKRRAYDVQLVLKNSQTGTEITSEWNGSTFVVTTPRWTAPDLAIICVHLNEEKMVDGDSWGMREFVERHAIPHILIRMDRGWRGSYAGLGIFYSLHESIQPQHDGSQGNDDFEFPVDMAGFLNLHTAQLNRHLAYLMWEGETASLSQQDSRPVKSEEDPPTVFDNLPRLHVALLTNWFMILWVVGIYTFLGYHLWPIWSDPITGANRGDVVTHAGAETLMQTAVAQVLSEVPSTTSFALGKESQSAHQVVDIASVSVSPSISEDTRHFQIGITGENQLLVKLPKVALSRKKRSQLLVELRRKNQSVPMAVQELFEGVFSVQLLPQDAYGDIEVSLRMNTPQLNDDLTVSFGDRSAVQRMQELWSTLHKDVREKASNGLTSMKRCVDCFIARQMQKSARKSFEKQLGYQFDWENWETKTGYDRTRAVLYAIAKREAQTVHASMVRTKEESLKQGRMLMKLLSSRYSDARSQLIDLVNRAKALKVQPKVDTAVVKDKLETARGRAHHIVSGTSRIFRGQNKGT